MGYDGGDSFPFDFMNQMGFHLVQNRKENCHHHHIPFNLKGNGNIVSLVQSLSREECSEINLVSKITRSDASLIYS